MKKITIQILTLLVTILTFSQSSQIVGYGDSALLLSTENINGTARYTAMAGAFGALGGNLSATNTNPAGLTVFNNSQFSLTLNNNSLDTNSNFYNSKTESNHDNFSFSQGGAVVIFDNNNNYWSKFAASFNYSIVNDFNNSYGIDGAGNTTIYNEDPFLNTDDLEDNDVFYENVDSQKFNNTTSGTNDKVTFSFAGQYNKNTSFGISINTHNVDYIQKTNFTENSNDGNNNTLNVVNNEKLTVYGEGVSINFGVISKPYKNLRVGLAYQTPTWYDITEEYENNTTQTVSNNTDQLITNPDFSTFNYKIRTASKLTGSAAYVFNKKGLISLDYTFKDLSTIKLKPGNEFNTENEKLKTLKNTSQIKIGGEYRLKNISLRAGYHIEENPVESISINNYGYSLGLGFKINNATNLDFSYYNVKTSKNYSISNSLNPIQIDKDSNRINATLTFGF